MMTIKVQIWRRKNTLLSVPDQDGRFTSLGPRALKSCPLLLGSWRKDSPGWENAEVKFTATSACVCVCVCVLCRHLIYARVCCCVSLCNITEDFILVATSSKLCMNVLSDSWSVAKLSNNHKTSCLPKRERERDSVCVGVCVCQREEEMRFWNAMATWQFCHPPYSWLNEHNFKMWLSEIETLKKLLS